jgi:hypothetical protein
MQDVGKHAFGDEPEPVHVAPLPQSASVLQSRKQKSAKSPLT